MRAHLYRPITDNLGNLRLGAVIRVLTPGTLTTLVDPLFADDASLVPMVNPLTAGNGVIDFYLDIPQRVRLGVQLPGESEQFFEAVDVLLPGGGGGSSQVTLIDNGDGTYTLTTV